MNDEALMREALALAQAAQEKGEVPVGAVVLRDGQVIAQRRNEREQSNDPTAHAEVLALSDAAQAFRRASTQPTLKLLFEP